MEDVQSTVLDPLLTVDEAAALLRLPPCGVRRLIAKGILPVIRLGIAIRIRREDLEQVLRPTPYVAMRHPTVNGKKSPGRPPRRARPARRASAE